MEVVNNVLSCHNGENTSELNIIRESLNDLCNKVSSLNNNVETTTLDGTECTMESSHHNCIASRQGCEIITDVIVDTGLQSDKCLVSENDAGCSKNNNDGERCAVKGIEEACPGLSVCKTIQKDTNISQDNYVKSERLANDSTSVTDSNTGNDALSEAETSSKIAPMDSSCCKPTDDTNGNVDMMDVSGHTVGGSIAAVQCSKITDDEHKVEVVLSETVLPNDNANSFSVDASMVDANGMVDGLMYAMSIVQNDMQYLNKLSIKDAIVKPVEDQEKSPSLHSETSSSSESSSSDESDLESVNTLKNSTANIHFDEEDEGDKITKCLPKTKDEVLLNELPPPAPLEIVVDENLEIKPLGEIESILNDSALVIIKSFANVPALDSDSILFCEDRSAFGQIFDIFGQVSKPHYCVRFDSEEDLAGKNLCIGQSVYYAPDTTEMTHFVFVSKLQRTKGSDASWKHDQEPPETLVAYSDDEAESKAKSTRKKANKLKKRNEDHVKIDNQSDNKAYASSQTSNQQYQTVPRPTTSIRPANSWAGNHRPNGGQFPHNPAFFPGSPRFGFHGQANHWSPVTNQYPPPPMPEQPRHTYNEHQYHQQPPRHRPPHHLAPLRFQQPHHEAQYRPPSQHYQQPMWHPPSEIHHARQSWSPSEDSHHNNYHSSPPVDQDYRHRFPYPPR